MSEDTEFHLVEQTDPALWRAFLSGLRPLYEQYLLEERGLLEQPTPEEKRMTPRCEIDSTRIGEGRACPSSTTTD